MLAPVIAIAIGAGGFAPTSLFGIVSYQIARQAGIDVKPLPLLAGSVVVNLLLVIAALAVFAEGTLTHPRRSTALRWRVQFPHLLRGCRRFTC